MKREIETLLLASAIALAYGCDQGDMDHEMGGADSTAMADSAGDHAGMDVTEIRSAIEEANAGFSETIAAGDVAAAAEEIYSDDAIIYPPGGEPVEGREGIVDFWTQAAQGITAVNLTTTDVSPAGDGMAWETGEFTIEGADGPLDRGSYIVIWKRTPEGWKIYRDIWNSDAAPAESGAASGDTTG